MSEATLVIVSFLGGTIPALFWLWFWLRQDKLHPEPKALIFMSFLAGMVVVPLVIPLQQQAYYIFSGDNLLFMWVIIEEVMKYAAALLVVLWRKAVDEPIDMVIYMITVALGFTALENALFIFNPLADGNIVESVLTSKFRFLGATLLHVLSSATIGVALALSFYKARRTRILYSVVGLAIAIVLHALFNFFIIDGNGEKVLTVFLFVWAGVVGLLLMLEKVKRVRRRQ